MIDHIGVTVSDFNRSKQFYRAALAAVNFELLLEFPAAVTGHTDVAGFGEAPKAEFWIAGARPTFPPCTLLLGSQAWRSSMLFIVPH